MTIPYASANSVNARNDTIKLLEKFGCESVGFMDDFADSAVILAFKHRGRPVQLRASAKGWAQLYLKENPYHCRSKQSRTDYEQAILRQGMKAVNSLLRDWVKGQITAVECGILQFEAVFMPYMLTRDGTPLLEKLRSQTDLLPPPSEEP